MEDTTMSTPAEPQAPIKKKKPIYKRVWFWIAVVIVLIVIISVSSGGSKGDDSSASPASSDPVASANAPSSSAEAPAPAPVPSTTAPVPPAHKPASAALTFQGQKKGDEVGAAGATLTVDKVDLTSTKLTDGDDTLGPTLCTTVTIKNNGDDAQSFNPFYFALQDPAGASHNSSFMGSDTLLSSGDLAPGGTTTGDVCFDNKTPTAGQYTVLYAPPILRGTRAGWVEQR